MRSRPRDDGGRFGAKDVGGKICADICGVGKVQQICINVYVVPKCSHLGPHRAEHSQFRPNLGRIRASVAGIEPDLWLMAKHCPTPHTSDPQVQRADTAGCPNEVRG